MEDGRTGASAQKPKNGRAPRIPDYEVLRFIGRGAYGDIWLVRSLTGALRAVKVIPRRRFEDDSVFDREFAGMARFEPISRAHEGFVEILHVGRNDRQKFFYYVMELADDCVSGQRIDPAGYEPRTLRAVLNERRLAIAECVNIGLALVRALKFLHERGLVHRDVKPANVIFVDDRPKLADIGLVATTGQRSFVGTEGYVPPEGPGTEQADLYGLGKVLYEISTGKDRFDFPELPSDPGPAADHSRSMALNEIILKACASNPARRYRDAKEMGVDLERLHEGLPAPLQHSSRRIRLWAAGIAILVALLAGAYWVANPRESRKMLERPAPSVTAIAEPAVPVPNLGRLELVTTPPGAAFEIENARHELRGGRTPVVLERLPAGPYTVRLRRLGWPVFSKEVHVHRGETLRVAWTFDAAARLGLPEPGKPWENSLEMRFAPVPGADVLFCVWETRVRDFTAFVDVTAYDATGWMSSLRGGATGAHGATWDKPGFNQSANHPVVGVSWKDAMAFCRWLTEKERRAGLLGPRQSYLLPTDEEWSRAVGLTEEEGATPQRRAGRLAGFPWGNAWPPPKGAGNFAGEEMREVDWPSNWKVIAGFRDRFGRTSPVGSFAPNRFGLFDLGGNAWEWCLGKFAESGDERLVRGGSWANVDPDLLMSSTRIAARPDERNDAYGFRVVVETYATGTVSIVSEPPGATVISEGNELGTTPLELPDLKTGETTFQLKLRGYRTATLAGNVEAGRTAEFRAQLEPSPGPVPGEPWTNSLGMSFVPVGDVLMCTWETRVSDYEAFCEASGHPPPPSPGFKQEPDHPVVRVNWADAEAFCRWLTAREIAAERLQNGERYRLPMDLEWSRAVGLEEERGASPEERDSRIKDVYPWGTEWPSPENAGNYGDLVHGRSDGFANTAPVGRFNSSPAGLFDLSGNVWEWILEPYRPSGRFREWGVLRGGSWGSDSRPTLLSSYRNVVSRDERDVLYGFRCVLEFREH